MAVDLLRQHRVEDAGGRRPASVPTPATLEDEMSPTASGVAAPASFGRKKTGPFWGSCSPAT